MASLYRPVSLEPLELQSWLRPFWNWHDLAYMLIMFLLMMFVDKANCNATKVVAPTLTFRSLRSLNVSVSAGEKRKKRSLQNVKSNFPIGISRLVRFEFFGLAIEKILNSSRDFFDFFLVKCVLGYIDFDPRYQDFGISNSREGALAFFRECM